MQKKRPMTTEELFDKICAILKEKGKLPDILDYGLATHKPVPIRTYEFELKNNLDYGSNEGIYLDLWIEYYEDNQRQRRGLGTFKTLGISNEDMRIMATLLADFIIEEYAYCQTAHCGRHEPHFDFGASVSPIVQSGRQPHTITSATARCRSLV